MRWGGGGAPIAKDDGAAGTGLGAGGVWRGEGCGGGGTTLVNHLTARLSFTYKDQK